MMSSCNLIIEINERGRLIIACPRVKNQVDVKSVDPRFLTTISVRRQDLLLLSVLLMMKLEPYSIKSAIDYLHHRIE